MRKLILLPIFFAILTVSGAAAQQPDSPASLYKTIQSLDAQLFNAYNHCDLKAFSSFFIEDVEFYHDHTGLTVGRKPLVDAVRKNICGKVTRKLVPGSLEVYPIANYGAVEIGVHRFYHPGHEDTEPAGEAKFIHLWQNKDGVWKITRVISFDHNAMPQQHASP